jgi:Flp pilus assembly protein CpaB
MIIERDPSLDSATPAAGAPTRERRVLRRSSRLPAGRAVVGGLLVALSIVGALMLSGAGSEPAGIDVVVASAAVRPGDALGPSVLRVERLSLPDALVGGTFADPAELEGTVARSNLEDGELLQAGDVLQGTAAQRAVAPAREFSLALDASRVGGGRLESGDVVDVLATYGTGADAFTIVVLRDARVVDARSIDDSIGSSRGLTVTLALDDRADTVALAHAVDVGQLTVVRTTTAEADDAEQDPYRPSDPTVAER